ncbi:MAG: protein kinase [Polyangia bacterium]
MTMQRRKFLPGTNHLASERDSVSFFSPPPESGSRVGRVLAGRYRLEALLGVGAMGEVFRAHDLRQHRPCAVKLVCPDAVLNLRAHRRFLNEAQLIARLFHPNIVEVREFNEDDDGTKFLVLELLEGEDLYEVLLREGRIQPIRSCSILRAVGAALQYAHDLGIVHRDIKPNNIFLCQQRMPSGQVIETVKVLDFGLAKLLDPPGEHGDGAQRPLGSVALTQGMIVGTPAYLSPEAARHDSSCVDALSDQWSLAVVAYHMLSGRLPFDDPNPYRLAMQICEMEPQPLKKLVPGLPEPLYRAVEIAMSKDPARRFQRVQDFIRALDGLPPLLSAYRSGLNDVRRTLAPGLLEASPSAPPAEQPRGAAAEPERQPELEAPRPKALCMAPAVAAQGDTGQPAASVSPAQAAPAGEPFDLLKTVQYTASELADLSLAMMKEQGCVPAVVVEESPTKPYAFPPHLTDALVEESIAAEESRGAAPPARPVAPEQSLKDAPTESAMLQTQLMGTPLPASEPPAMPALPVEAPLSAPVVHALGVLTVDRPGGSEPMPSQDAPLSPHEERRQDPALQMTRIHVVSQSGTSLFRDFPSSAGSAERGRFVSWRLLGLSSVALFLSLLSALLLGARLGNQPTRRDQAAQAPRLSSVEPVPSRWPCPSSAEGACRAPGASRAAAARAAKGIFQPFQRNLA